MAASLQAAWLAEQEAKPFPYRGYVGTNLTVGEAALPFENEKFKDYLLWFGLPWLISVLYTWAFLHFGVAYRYDRIRSKFADVLDQWQVLVTWVSLVTLVVQALTLAFTMMAPVGLLFIFGLAVAVDVNHVFGTVIIFLGTTVMAAIYAFGLWYTNRGRLTPSIFMAFGCVVAMTLATLLTILSAVYPFEITSYSAYFLIINSMALAVSMYFSDPVGGIWKDIAVFAHGSLEARPQMFDFSHVSSLGPYLIAILSLVGYVLTMGGFLNGDLVPSDKCISGVGVGPADPEFQLCGDYTRLALVNAAFLIVVDITLFWVVKSGTITNPRYLSALSVFSRVPIIFSGDYHWFMGHIAVFLIVELAFGMATVVFLLPVAVNFEGIVDTIRAINVAMEKGGKRIDSSDDDLEVSVNGNDDESTSDAGADQREEKTPSVFWRAMANPLYPLVFFLLFFLAEVWVVGSYKLTEPIVLVGGASLVTQWEFGLVAANLVLFAVCLFAAYRCALRDNLRLTYLVIFLVLFAIVNSAAVGVELYHLTDLKGFLFAFVMDPFLVIAFAAGFTKWRANDYSIVRPLERSRRHAFDPLIFSAVVTYITIGCLHVALFYHFNEHRWDAITFGFVITVVPLHFLAIVKYMQNLKVEWFVHVTMDLSLLIFLAYNIYTYTVFLEADSDDGGLGLLAFDFLYGCVFLAILAFVIWRDTGYRYNSYGFLCFFLSFVFAVVGSILILLTDGNEGWGAGLLFLIFMILFLGAIATEFVRSGHFLPWYWKLAGGFVFLLACGAGVLYGYYYDVFLGFSIGMLSLFVASALYALEAYFSNLVNPFLYTSGIFPVYRYSPSLRIIEQDNNGTIAAYVALLSVWIWGCGATVLLNPIAVGVCTTLYGICMLVIFSCELLHVSSRSFELYARACSRFSTGRNLLDEARQTALSATYPKADPVAQSLLEEAKTRNLEQELIAVAHAEHAAYHYGTLEKYTVLDNLDRRVSLRHQYEQRFSAYLQALAHFLSIEMDRLDIAMMTDALLHMRRADNGVKYSDMTPEDIYNWGVRDLDAFIERLEEYVAGLGKQETGTVVHREFSSSARRTFGMGRSYPPPPPSMAQMSVVAAVGGADSVDSSEETESSDVSISVEEQEEQATDVRESLMNERAFRMRMGDAQGNGEDDDIHYSRGGNDESEFYYWRHTDASPVAIAADEMDSDLREAIDERIDNSFQPSALTPVVGNLDFRKGVTIFNKKTIKLGENQSFFSKLHQAPPTSSANYEELVAQCQSLDEMFVDPDFPEDGYEDCEWKRLSEIVFDDGGRMVLLNKGKHQGEPKQGDVKDSWLISAFTTLNSKPNAVKAVFVDDSTSAWGIYCVYLFDLNKGTWCEVVVDDRVPCTDGKPIVASSSTREMWPSILEKAFAKFYGSYGALDGGLPSVALATLTGGVASTVDYRADTSAVVSGAAWKSLLDHHSLGFLMSASVASDAFADKGVDSTHTYTILDVRQVDGHHLVHLYNPHAAREWNGAWGDDDKRWTNRRRKLVGQVAANDGAFWIDFANFVQAFPYLHECRIHTCDHWAEVDMGSDFAGGRGFSSLASARKYRLTVTRPTRLDILLAQDMSEQSFPEVIGVSLHLTCKSQAFKTSMISGIREVFLDTSLAPGQYYLVARCAKDIPLKFSLRVFSDHAVKLESAK